jgi:hypothetical protein
MASLPFAFVQSGAGTRPANRWWTVNGERR